MNYLRAVDRIYKETQLARLEMSEISAMIDNVIEEMCIGESKFFKRQMRAYEYEKYLDTTKREIGKMLGYTESNYHSAVIYNCKVINNYLSTRDTKYYDLILTIDEKLQTILK